MKQTYWNQVNLVTVIKIHTIIPRATTKKSGENVVNKNILVNYINIVKSFN